MEDSLEERFDLSFNAKDPLSTDFLESNQVGLFTRSRDLVSFSSPRKSKVFGKLETQTDT